MRRLFHYILFAITVALGVVCGIMMFHVNVNADMTKYLPDDSQMKSGLEIVMNEFGSSAQMSGADVHVMFEGMRPNEVPGIRTLLEGYEDVRGVSYRYSADSTTRSLTSMYRNPWIRKPSASRLVTVSAETVWWRRARTVRRRRYP